MSSYSAFKGRVVIKMIATHPASVLAQRTRNRHHHLASCFGEGSWYWNMSGRDSHGQAVL